MESKKSRHLSTYEYLQILQLEYIVAELRRKIYVKKKDKDFFKRVLDGKEKKIKDICLRNNNLPSIFSSEEIKSKCYSQVYPSFGYPDFQYKGDEQVQEFKMKDFYYYYSIDSDFRIKEGNETKIGQLVSVDEEAGIVYLKLRGESTTRPFTTISVSRII